MSGMRGIEQFRANLAELDKKMRNKIIRKAIRVGAKIMAREVKRRAPVRTGVMAKNIKIKAAKRKKDNIRDLIYLGIGGKNKTHIVAFQEFGTEKQAPNPFIRQSFEATKGQVIDEAVEAVRQGIKEFAGPKRAGGKLSGL